MVVAFLVAVLSLSSCNASGNRAAQETARHGRKAMADLPQADPVDTLNANSDSVVTGLSTLLQMHGSGSATVATFLRKVMHTLVDNARPIMRMTYRMIDTIQAQLEMLDVTAMYVGYNHVKAGDTPLSPLQFETLSKLGGGNTGIAQFPVALSSVSLFVHQSLPFLTVMMDACTVLSVFKGDTPTWSDPQLAALNGWDVAGLQDSPMLDFNITVFGFANASSITQTVYAYLRKACDYPPLDASDFAKLGAQIQWGPKVQTSFNGRPILTAADMVAAIAGTGHSIGYAPSSVGLAANLTEVYLQNVDGNWLTSATADLTLAVLLSNLPTNVTSDWSAVDLLYRGGPRAWPMTTLVYIYVFTNLAPYGPAGPLVEAVLNYTLSPDGQALLPGSGLTPLPPAVVALLQPQVHTTFTVESGSPTWDMEYTNLFSNTGMGLFTFSGNRESDDVLHNQAVDTNLDLLNTLTAQQALVRVAGPEDLAKLGLLATQGVVDSAGGFLTIPYETSTNYNSKMPMLVTRDYGQSGTANTDILLANEPMRTFDWRYLQQSGQQFIQLPWLVRPVGLFYRGPAGLHFSPCTVRALLEATALDPLYWDDARIQADNPTLTLPHTPISFYYTSELAGDVMAMVAYAQLACLNQSAPIVLGGSMNPVDTSFSTPVYATTPGMMPTAPTVTAAQVASTVSSSSEYTGVGIGPPPVADTFGVSYVALSAPSAVDTRLTPMMVQQLGDFSQVLENAFAARVGIPLDPTGDWTNFTLANMTWLPPLSNTENLPEIMQIRMPVYPVLRPDYIIVPVDVTNYGSRGGAVQGTLSYLTDASGFQKKMEKALGTNYAPLGPLARDYANKALQRVVRGPSAAPWLLVNTTADTLTSPQWPANAVPIALSRTGLATLQMLDEFATTSAAAAAAAATTAVPVPAASVPVPIPATPAAAAPSSTPATAQEVEQQTETVCSAVIKKSGLLDMQAAVAALQAGLAAEQASHTTEASPTTSAAPAPLQAPANATTAATSSAADSSTRSIAIAALVFAVLTFAIVAVAFGRSLAERAQHVAQKVARAPGVCRDWLDQRGRQQRVDNLNGGALAEGAPVQMTQKPYVQV